MKASVWLGAVRREKTHYLMRFFVEQILTESLTDSLDEPTGYHRFLTISHQTISKQSTVIWAVFNKQRGHYKTWHPSSWSYSFACSYLFSSLPSWFLSIGPRKVFTAVCCSHFTIFWQIQKVHAILNNRVSQSSTSASLLVFWFRQRETGTEIARQRVRETERSIETERQK